MTTLDDLKIKSSFMAYDNERKIKLDRYESGEEAASWYRQEWKFWNRAAKILLGNDKKARKLSFRWVTTDAMEKVKICEYGYYFYSRKR